MSMELQVEFSEDPSAVFGGVSLPHTAPGTVWDVITANGLIVEVLPHDDSNLERFGSYVGGGALLAPSLCHPHVHIDKAYLLAHPNYSHLQIEKGDFQEAMTLTGKAKSMFEHDDLIERGQRLIDESAECGVTHMRGFVEVDAGVGTKCLEAGIELRQRAAARRVCAVQLCAFAQLPVWTASEGDEDGSVIRGLMRAAAERSEVEAIGSTPYVEGDIESMKRNVEFLVDLSIEFNKHLDFHLDYNLDRKTTPLVWHVIETLRTKRWKEQTKGKTIVLGHCTRLALFDDAEWRRLAEQISAADLPISFVGLPTSDLFMMRTGEQPEVRGTLNIPRCIKEYGLNACIGINNIGNAFTPQGSCDPLGLACHGIGIYQAGTSRDAEILFECVSTRAKAAIGFESRNGKDDQLEVRKGDKADLVFFKTFEGEKSWHTRRNISEAIYLYDHGKRTTFLGGKRIRMDEDNDWWNK